MRAIERTIPPYLKETLGVGVSLSAWGGVSRLPAFITERYRILQGTLVGHPVLFMIDASRREQTPGVVRKHVEQVRLKCDRPVVYVREGVTAYNRKRLIEHRVPFIVPGNQMYLPDLGIDLRERVRSPAREVRHFRPATQAVLLQLLLDEGEGPVVGKDLSRRMGYSTMTLSRAFDEIEEAGLAESRMAGRERGLKLAATRREVWERAQPMLRDPVGARHFVFADRESAGLRAGLSALAEQSMLGEPENVVTAMSREDWAKLRSRGDVREIPYGEPGAYEIEVWSYAPRPHRERGIVDPLSLYLSLRGSGDERIERALGDVLEKLPW